MKDNISTLYGALKNKGYTDIGKDETEFRDWLGKEGNVKTLYGALSQQGFDDIGDEHQFTEWVGIKPKSEDDEVFEANAERFRNGHPTEKVTTQSMIDANPELGLQKTEQKLSATEQYILDNRPDMFGKGNASLMDAPLGSAAQTPELSGDKLQDLAGTLDNVYDTVNKLGDRMMKRSEILKRNLEDPTVQKGRTEANMRGLLTEIGGLLEKEHRKLKSKVPVGQNAFNALMGSTQYNQSNKDTQKNISNLDAAKRLLEQSQYIVDAAKRGDTGILNDTWQGFKDSLEAEDFTFGLADAASSAAILDAIKKVEKGKELTESEDKLLRASAINMAVQYNFANDLGRGYGMGQVSAESIPFMLEMAINPISSFGSASAKTLLNYGLKSFAKQVGKGLLKGAAAGTGMAVTTGLGRVSAGTTDRLARNYNYGVDFDGNLYAEKKDETMGVGEAFARSLASTAIENQSEMIFNAFKGVGGLMKGVNDVLPGGVNKFFDLLKNNKAADAYRWLKNSKVFRNYLVKDGRNATQIGGIFEEYAEEVYNNLANFAIGEMSWDELTDLDNNIDTFLGLAPTQVMFGLLGLGGAGAMRYQTRRVLEDLQATMNEQQRKELEGLLDMGLDAEEVDVRGFIRGVMQNDGYTIDNKRDMIKAAFYVAKQNGIDQLTEADVIDKVNAENSLIDSVTDPSTGLYSELTATLPDGEGGQAQVPGYILGWIGEGESRQPIFLAEGTENTYENRRVLKPGQWNPESIQQMPAEQVKAVNEEMIREEEAVKAENESRWHPDVPEPQEGVSFFNGEEEVTIVGTDGNGGLFVVPTEEYNAAQGNEKKMAEVVNRSMQLGVIPIEQYKDAMTAQLEANEAQQAQAEEAASNTQAVVENMPRKTDETGRIFVPTSVQGDEVAYDITDAQGNTLEQGTSKVSQFAKMQDYVAPVETPLNDDGTTGEAVGEGVNAGVNGEVNNPEASGVNASPVEESKPNQPTLEDVVATLPKNKNGEIDYGAMTPQQQYEYTSLSESPEVALEDLQADIAANEEEIAKVQEQLAKARGGKRAELRDKVKKLTSANEELKAFYQSVAPKQEVQETAQTIETGKPAGYAAEEVASGSKSVVVESEKPKRAKKPKLVGKKKNKDSEFTDEELRPANGVELAAEQFAAGNVKITVDSYKKETGFGEKERKSMGLTPYRSSEKGGMTVEQAAEYLVEVDNAEHNGSIFGGDTMAARDAIIELFSTSEKWGDVTGYIKNSRMAERKKREEAEYEAYEDYIMQTFHMSVSDYESMKEYDEQNNPFEGIDMEGKDAIFAEEYLRYEQYLNSINNDEGRTNETSERGDSVLPQERVGDFGGNQRNESQGIAESVGSESVYNSETSQESAFGSEVAPSIEETNVSRMADIEAEVLDIEGRRLEIEDELNEIGNDDLLRKAELIDELSRLDVEQSELEAEYSGLRAMNDESNAISEAEGSGLHFRKAQFREERRRQPLRERANEWSNKLGVKVKIMESLDDVTNPSAKRAISRGQVVTGWFEESTGEVCLYMPNIASESEVDATYIHEVVSHKGLRGLLGDKFDSFCDEVWDMMSDADRLEFMNYPGVSHLEGKEKYRAAADEYIARLAENIDVTESAWSKLTELIKKFLKALGIEPKMTNADIANTIKKSYQRLISGENAESGVSGEGTRFNAKRVSDRRQDKNRVNNTVDQALSIVYGKDVKDIRKERQEKEQKRKEDAAEIYESVLSGDFNDVTLQKINDYIDDATPLHPYGKRISQRLPQKLERGLHEGARTNAVDALFSRICESAVPASRRASEAGRREIEERKKEALKGWAIATNNWHTDLSDFADEADFIRQGTDSKVYLAKDGKHVIKVSFGKPEGKRFRPDIDTTALFNSVFRNTAYEIVGYGEFDGKFARILKQPFVDFADKTALNADEREEYMRTLGFEPINESRTAFSNGSIVAADLQKSNILKDASGNISVIDADMKLHTKDVGGDYTYPPVEADVPEGTRFRFIGERGARNLDKAEEATTRLDNLGVAREMEAAEKDAKAIKMATGWERGADGKWRYEVDDNISFDTLGERSTKLKKAYSEAQEKYYRFESCVPSRTPKNATEEEKQRIKDMRKELSKLRKEMLKASDAYYGSPIDDTTLGDFIGEDNNLFKEYPELKDVSISFVRNARYINQGFKGFYDPEANSIWIDDWRPKGDIKSSLLHEIQHAIQHIEGFSWGGSAAFFEQAKEEAQNRKYEFNELINKFGFEDWEKNIPFEELMAYGKKYKGEFGLLHLAFIENAIEDKYVQADLRDELESVKAAYNRFYEKAGGEKHSYKTPRDWYLSLGGEVEARNVQQRMGMTDEQRRNSLAESTEDVAREDQIFLQNAMEGQTMFRVSDKKKEDIQKSVDKFTSRYNSKETVVAEVSSMTDEEIEEMFDSPASEVKDALNEGLTGGYSEEEDKIYIFADNLPSRDVEDTMFHENLHGLLTNDQEIVDAFFKEAEARFPKNIQYLRDLGYKESEIPEELFIRLAAKAMDYGIFDDVIYNLPEDAFERFKEIIKEFGYGYEQEIRSRILEESGRGTSQLLEGEEIHETGRLSEAVRKEQAEESATKRTEAIRTLFGQVADMGLGGVLGNKAYTKLMVDIFKELPKDVRTSLADDALRHYGGSIAPAVSDYVNKKGKANLWDKIAGFIREALRKAGIEVELNGNDAKYLLWRSQKPLDRVNLIDVAEDIDMRYRMKVGEYSSTRFRVGKKKASKTVLPEDESSFKGSVVSDADRAKVLNNLDNLQKEYEEKSAKRQKTFISDLSKAMHLKNNGNNSNYADYVAVNGDEVTIRVSDHNVSVKDMDDAGKTNGISIVIGRKENKGVRGVGDAHIVEYYYNDKSLHNSEGNPYAEIINSFRQTVYSGEYKDTTGLAERQEVNPTRFRVDGENSTSENSDEPMFIESSEYEKLKNQIQKQKMELGRLRKIVSEYKNEDEVKDEILKFIRKQVGSNVTNGVNKSELNILLAQVREAKSKKSIEHILNNVRKAIQSAQRRELQRVIDNLLSLKVQDVNGKNMSIAKNVDDSTRKIFEFIRGHASDLKISAYDDSILQLKRENRDLQLKKQSYNRELSSSETTEERKSELESLIAEVENTIAENVDYIKELRGLKNEIIEHKADYADLNIDNEIRKLEEKIAEAAEGKAVWTQGDTERMAALNIIQAIITNRKHDFEVENIEEEIKSLHLANSDLNKVKIKVENKDKRHEINEQMAENRRKIAALQRLINDARTTQISQMKETIEQLNELVSNGKNSLMRKVEEEVRRRGNIIGNGLRSVEGKPIDIFDDKAKQETWYKKFFSAPLGSFEYMCKRVNTKTLGKDGFLYKYFIQGENGVLEAYNTYLKGLKEVQDRMKAKSLEIFGKSYDKIASESDKVIDKTGVYIYDVKQGDGYGQRYEKPMSKAQAMYIYMVWKMDDGRTKLELQGFDEESISEIVEFIGDDYVKYADWIQNELLPDTRLKYNERYLELFNTSMADIPNYVPLRIRQESIYQESDLSADKQRKKTLEERAGSLINRVVNTNPVDITMSAFDVVNQHVNQMEEWNAYARVRRDLDALLSNTTFRNQLNANVAGSFENFYDAAAVATKAYHPDRAKHMDEVLGKLSKGIVGGNIAYRLSTALKQILSAPAFFGYSQHPLFGWKLAKNAVNTYATYKWALENLPSFRERVESGTAGNEKLNEKSFKKWMDKYIEVGMIPNKTVDAITCSIGARSIYEFKMEQLKKQGLSDEEARRQALMDADTYYNATQQSSHPAFMSPIQMSRTLADRMLTTYQNSNIGYVRKMLAAYYDLTRSFKWKELMSNYTDMYVREEGISEADAKVKARARLLNENRKSVVEIALFGWGLNILWNIGSQGLLGFFAGDDDDEDDKWTKDVGLLLTSPIKGMPGGNLIESISQGYGMNPFLVYDELEGFMRSAKYAVDEYGIISPEVAYKTLEAASRYAGVDLQVWGNMYMGVEGMVRDGATDGDAIIDLMYILNSPKSAREEVAKNLYKGEPILEFAEKVNRARKYVPKNDPWESWVPGNKPTAKRQENEAKRIHERLNMTDEERKKADEKKIADKFKRKLKEYGDDEEGKKDYIERHEDEYQIYKKFYK